MSWDDNIKNLPDQQGPFIDMLDTPQTTDEVQRLGAPIIIPADRTVKLWLAVREPSVEVPNTVETWVNGVKYSEVKSEVELIGNTFLVNYAASRVKFPQSEVGKAITKLPYQNWGTQNRALFYIQGYQGLRDIRAVAQNLFNALEANENFHIKIQADNETQLYTNFPPSEYPGADAYAGGQKYYSNGLNWVKLEDITALDPVPQLLSVSPSLGQTSVALPANVEITFSQSMNADDLLSKFSLKDRNANPIAGAFRFYDKNGMEVTSSSSKIRKMLFDPTTDLAIEASPYYVELLPCENILGTQMVASFTSNFSCAADMLPTGCQITTGAIDGQSAEIIMVSEGSDYEGPVTYDVYLRDVSAGGTFLAVTDHQGLTAIEFPRTLNTLTISTNFEVKVVTKDSSGQVIDSNILAFQTSGVINNAPSAPTISLVSIGDGVITIRLESASVDTEDGTITNYNIYVDGGLYAQDIALNVGGTTQITGVTNGQTYSITAKGKDSGGKLSSSSSAVGATPLVNSTPTISSLSAIGTPTNINYKGTITDAESNSITGLKIQRRPAGGADWVTGMVEHVTTNATDITNFRGVGGLDIAGTYTMGNYDFRVCAMDSGSGQYGAWVESLKASGGGFNIASFIDTFTASNNTALDTAKWQGYKARDYDFITLLPGTKTDIQNNSAKVSVGADQAIYNEAGFWGKTKIANFAAIRREISFKAYPIPAYDAAIASKAIVVFISPTVPANPDLVEGCPSINATVTPNLACMLITPNSDGTYNAKVRTRRAGGAWTDSVNAIFSGNLISTDVLTLEIDKNNLIVKRNGVTLVSSLSFADLPFTDGYVYFGFMGNTNYLENVSFDDISYPTA